MKKVFRLAVLTSNKKDSNLCSQHNVTQYTYITAQSYSHIKYLAERIGAVVCGWRVAA